MFSALGYQDRDDFLRRGLELDPALVDWAIKGLKQLRPDEAIPFVKAVELGRWGYGPGRGHKRGNNITSFRRGTDPAYFLARLDRDHPDLAVRVRSGELKPYAAAKAAGIVKIKTSLEQLQHWWRKASADERQAFLRFLRESSESTETTESTETPA